METSAIQLSFEWHLVLERDDGTPYALDWGDYDSFDLVVFSLPSNNPTSASNSAITWY